jgi:hypothetical protein
VSFKLKCPKCGSLAVSLTRERNGFGPPQGDPVLSCRCGKRMYGVKAVEAEYLKQKAEWVEPEPNIIPMPVFKAPPKDEYIEKIRTTLVGLEALSTKAVVSMREVVFHVRRIMDECNYERTEDETSRKFNRFDIEVAIVERLHHEIKEMVADAFQLSDAWMAQRRIPQVKVKLKALAVTAFHIPGLVPDLEERLRQYVPPDTTPRCARAECGEVAAEDRKYCGDKCRVKQARANYKAKWAGKKKPTKPTMKPIVPVVTLPVVIVPVITLPPEPRKPSHGFDVKGETALMETNLMLLRKYARNDLGIIGASKIRGGKPALVSRILEVRGQ